MASLREIKDRIGSVRSTLKITSAMKLVASAKLRKAQRAIEGMRPYDRTLAEILAALGPQRVQALAAGSAPAAPASGRTAVVAVSSNRSLCGGFNANVARKALETIRACEGGVEVYPLGRKIAEALRRAGYCAAEDRSDLVAHPSYEASAALARTLAARFRAGELSRVVLVYNRFVSAASQVPVAEQYLPFSAEDLPAAAPQTDETEYLVEPDAAELVAQLLPQVLTLKFHAAILDSAAAEHAARTLAMQTASDNAEDLLGTLTLEYNKGRQQKITAEILDLIGGASES